MQKARIKLTCSEFGELNAVCNEIIEVAKRTGVKHSGIIALPTKKMVITCKRGMGLQKSFERWHMRIHKRIIDIQADERTLRRVMRVEIPESVHMEIELKNQ